VGVVVLIGLKSGISRECFGSSYGRQLGSKDVNLDVSFVSKNVVRGRREEGSVLAFECNAILKSMSVNEGRVDLCYGVMVDIGLGLGSVCDNAVSMEGSVVYYMVNNMVLDVGGVVLRHTESLLHLVGKGEEVCHGVWSYGFYSGVLMEDVFFRPSLYCIYKSYDEGVALEGRIKHQWSLLPWGLQDFMLGFAGEIGYDYTGKPYGLPYVSSLGRKDYWYYGAALSLIYKLAIGEASIGVSYEGNAASKNSWVNCGESYKNNVWFNALLNFSF
jgi:hypothetical protein